jgi:hypothetical protein
MFELTPDQRAELRRPEPARAIDPETKQEYVLVRADIYERLKGVLGEDFHPSEAYPAVDRAFAEAWDDPKMDDYDRYEELKK